ncbi:HTTM domain-containing protein [Flavobacterium sp. RHBU_3]|uniref:HTTM domain-containing protein n=1 Tax=Flavobacterium sp. RHBU_3 TaxID=3391184 RepID=UPI0039852E11
MQRNIQAYLNAYTDAASLAFYRLAFGIMMFLGMLRFALNGWIDKFYIKPVFHFTYYGFSWVKPFGVYTYLLFIVCAVSALMVAFGYKYRLGIILFFLSFTYIELMDKTTYLNHYYFISVVSFVMMFLPANAFFSVDAHKDPKLFRNTVPRYTVDVLKILLGIVYFYAGIAKLNSDWLLHAQPLRIWLPANAHLPVIGPLMGKEWAAYAFSYIGTVYDLSIPFLLLNKRTRWFAFILVVVFHVLTRILFPIGIFPFVMIVSTLIFFSGDFHRKVLNSLKFQVSGFRFNTPLAPLKRGTTSLEPTVKEPTTDNRQPATNNLKAAFLALIIIIQLLFPFRYLCYPGELFWTEEGFRLSWRVMLMEKAGYAQFSVSDPKTHTFAVVDNSKFLTRFQEKQMAFQPDFILEYAHFLHNYYKKQGMADPEVRVKSYVTLNGRLSRPYIDPNVNLAKQDESFRHKTWILPFNDTIKGF